MMFRKTFSGDKNGCYKMTKTFVCITILCVFKYSSYLMAIRTLSHFHSLPYFLCFTNSDRLLHFHQEYATNQKS